MAKRKQRMKAARPSHVVSDPIAPALMAFPPRTEGGKFIGNMVSLMTLGVQATIKDLLRLTHGIAGLVGVEEAKAIVEGSLNALHAEDGASVKVHVHTKAQREITSNGQARAIMHNTLFGKRRKSRSRRRRTLSAEGRARIIAAQKARREREAREAGKMHPQNRATVRAKKAARPK